MGYESLSTIVVLVILMIIVVGWLPRRTVNSMKRVAEHRQDRYSSSLHLVDADSGTRFSDEHTPQPKGAIMQRTQTGGAKLTRARVAHIRELRRAAIRRRRILAVSLLLITVVVAAIAFPLHFSPLFALIPAGLLTLVLALGARASRHARQWEHDLAVARRKERAAQLKMNEQVTAVNVASGSRKPAQSAASPADEKTDVMEGQEIRQVLQRARIEQDYAIAARQARIKAREYAQAAERAARQAREESVEADAQAVAAPSSTQADGRRDVQAAVKQSVKHAEPAQQTVAEPQPHADEQSTSADSAAARDMTTELDRVHPAAALDAFAVAASQDLISFSLGEPRNGVEHHAPEPESREIQSTRQVAKAVPPQAAVKPDAPAQDDAKAQSDGSAADRDAAVDDNATAVEHAADASVAAVMDDDQVNDTAAFHQSEMVSSVAAPAVSSESLGNDLEAILARRSN
ncbi:hypothetical protein [Bifidobacterium leontopitheci]|uniref:YjbE family integral membrane protein n=1 Tax=Bifidobacterium leontopitheci TaxID=2650774 RepID=A0A6I1GGV4_9BIFI|nr:hypothetical protein [Bifidobacterium leontopitheci]KAB7790913.1 hypothetical protein F7D09_0648 [Bifidobacterium leontopitheci]